VTASLAAAALLVLAASAAPLHPTETALQQANDLEQRARAAVKASDPGGRIAADLGLLHLLNGSPAALEALARAYAASGETDKALAALDQLADLGLADEGLLTDGDRRLAAIANLPAYRQILARFSRNQAPVLLSKVAFTLPDAGLLAEDIDYDAHSRSFLVTSVLEHRIIRVRSDGAGSDFAASPDGWPMVALKVDAPRERVWATEVAFDGFAAAPRSAWGRSALLAFDLRSGRILQRIEAPLHASLGDMVLTPQGEPLVSDGDNGVLYRLSRGRLIEANRADFISPQTPAMAPGRTQAQPACFVPDYVRGIARFDVRSAHADWLNQDGSDKVALIGIDGLYIHHRSLIATQNGVSPERVVLFELDPSFTHIVSSRVIEQSAATGTDPTHGVVVADSFYYIANAGWAQLDEHGELRAGAKLTAARVMRYDF
jgi:hypothetical protein